MSNRVMNITEPTVLIFRLHVGRDSSVSIVIRYGLHGLGIEFRPDRSWTHPAPYKVGRGQLKSVGTRAETRFRLSAK